MALPEDRYPYDPGRAPGVTIVERHDTLQAPLINIEGGQLFLRPFSVMILDIEIGPGQIMVETSVIPSPGTYHRGQQPADGDTDQIKVIFSFPIADRDFNQLTDEDIKHSIRHALREVMKHEVDECLRNLDGSHFHDPHSVVNEGIDGLRRFRG